LVLKKGGDEMVKLTSLLFLLLLAGTGCSRLAASNALPAAAASRGIPSTRDASTYKVIYRFDGDDGGIPQSPLIAIKGKLYGGTAYGGKSNCGVVFSLSTAGTDEKALHVFDTDGCNPVGLTYAKKSLYCVTYKGGKDDEGAVVRLKESGKEVWSDSFAGVPDEENPDGGVIFFKKETYGTTSAGGSVCGGDGCGTIFKVSKKGQASIIYQFQGEEKGQYDGSTPYAGLVAAGGTLYGTTAFGGDHDGGTVFSVTTSGKENVVYSFLSVEYDAQRPDSALIDIGGTLYGTSEYGGKNGLGTVFSVTTGGTENVIHSFGSGKDGWFPQASLVNVNGTLYGTTVSGGSSSTCSDGCGTIFKLSTSGGETILHNFQGGKDGELPRAGLLFYKGKLYGTTQQGGGSNNDGTVFELTP
jgi:uncharacterized repeat protein (TIGR03803 family)